MGIKTKRDYAWQSKFFDPIKQSIFIDTPKTDEWAKRETLVHIA